MKRTWKSSPAAQAWPFDWINANGRPQRVTPDALRAVLKGLGHPADSDAEINTSLLELERAQQDKHLPPLMTVDSGDGLDFGALLRTRHPVPCQPGRAAKPWTCAWTAPPCCPGIIALGYHQVHINDQTFTLAVAPTHCYSVADWSDSQPAAPGA